MAFTYQIKGFLYESTLTEEEKSKLVKKVESVLGKYSYSFDRAIFSPPFPRGKLFCSYKQRTAKKNWLLIEERNEKFTDNRKNYALDIYLLNPRSKKLSFLGSKKHLVFSSSGNKVYFFQQGEWQARLDEIVAGIN